MTNNGDPLARAQNTAHQWLATIGDTLGTDDRRYTYRVVRAWLHTLRDRLTIECSSHFSAQLPELLRGTFYDGWVPSRVPNRYDCDDCIDRIATAATIRRADVRTMVRGVSEGMRQLLSPGTLDNALEHLPRDVKEMFTPARPARVVPNLTKTMRGDTAELSELRRQVEHLVGTVSDLSRQLAEQPAGAERPAGHDPEALAVADDVVLPRQSYS